MPVRVQRRMPERPTPRTVGWDADRLHDAPVAQAQEQLGGAVRRGGDGVHGGAPQLHIMCRK